MVQEILCVADELALWFEREAAAEGVGRLLVQRTGVDRRCLRTPSRLVRGELAEPPERVPQSRIIGSRVDGALDERQSFIVHASARDEQRAQVFERFDERWIEEDRLSGEIDRRLGVATLMRRERRFKQALRFRVRRRQRMPSTSASASCSVNTRNVFVRTLPWLLTASETRVIVSSSGASAMTT